MDKYAKSEAVSGPRECNDDPTGPCCINLEFTSSGNLLDSEQKHILGNYARLSDGPAGTWNYKQTAGTNKLWYHERLRVLCIFLKSEAAC